MVAPQYSCNPAFTQDLLNAMNQIRAQHGSPPLQHSTEISAHAQLWVDILASKAHLRPQPNNPYGEILYELWYESNYGNRISISSYYPMQEFTAQSKQYYFYGNEPDPCNRTQRATIAKWSQLLWRSTWWVGFGCALVPSRGPEGGSSFYLVYNFDPRGNVECEYKRNVLPEVGSPPYQVLIAGGMYVPAPQCQKSSTIGI